MEDCAFLSRKEASSGKSTMLRVNKSIRKRSVTRKSHASFASKLPLSCRVSHEWGMILALANSHRSVKGEHPSGRGLRPDASGSPWGGDSLDCCLSLKESLTDEESKRSGLLFHRLKDHLRLGHRLGPFLLVDIPCVPR